MKLKKNPEIYEIVIQYGFKYISICIYGDMSQKAKCRDAGGRIGDLRTFILGNILSIL